MSNVGETHQSTDFESWSGNGAELIAILEARVASLVERHREALQTIDELRQRLDQAESRLKVLETDAQSHEDSRQLLYQRVTKLIDRIRELERTYASQQGGA
jgi:chromosome segregation ATPase